MSFNKDNKNIKIPDYFSDDEVEEQYDRDDDDIMYHTNHNEYERFDGEEFDEEMDEEMNEERDREIRRIIFESAVKNIDKLTCDFDELNDQDMKLKEDKLNYKKLKKEIKTEKKGKNIFNLSEFNKKVEEDIKANQPKKFVSKRADSKRKELGISSNENTIKRSFNPRKEPYNFVKSHEKKETILELINQDEFPSL